MKHYVTSFILIGFYINRYYTPKPNFQLSISNGFYECKIILPPNAAFQTIVGPLSSNSQISKQLACLEACKKLHQMGALNDHLQPSIEEPSANDLNINCKESASGAGMHFYEHTICLV